MWTVDLYHPYSSNYVYFSIIVSRKGNKVIYFELSDVNFKMGHGITQNTYYSPVTEIVGVYYYLVFSKYIET